MSQDQNEQGYFTHLLNPNSSYQQEIGSNPSTPSSQHSQSSSSYQQYPGFGTQYSTAIPPPEHIFRQQQQAFFNHQLNNQFQNFQKKNATFQNLQKQPDAFQQSQPQPRFKEPQPQPPTDKRKKRVAKRATVNLVDENDEEEEPIRQCAHWSREEEILLTQCWIETSENGQIGADRSEDSRKLQAGTSAYEAKKLKEVAMMEFKEMEFLTIDVDLLPEPKASIIRNRQEKIIAKYAQQ
ncbi:hypothetical protein Tco_0993033 [Tanacetum coccineum]|uniref:Uncharacterized protein n=1 Tax=Tanacetum coccineum TaxID=301880 RepID=A0ABQ5F4X0_9ASTR